MEQMLVVTLREGIEAFLIVAIAAAYLRKTGRVALLPAVWSGATVAAVLSLVLGLALAQYAVLPIWEAILALVAAVLVISMVIYMLRAARRMRADIGRHLEAAVQRPGRLAWLGVFVFTVLMITREGMEMAFITGALAGQAGAGALVTGAIAGAALAGLLAWAWTRWGHRVNLALFFQVTSIFLLLFAAQLVLYSFHEFTEANVLPIDNAYWHIATEPYGPEGEYGAWFPYALVLVPAAWLIASWWRARAKPVPAAG
ncbi:MAG TPA: FTR1 family protein [Burkholderiales bacterium]|nr:FTR1 family protein [Burkholderiales bacterium]